MTALWGYVVAYPIWCGWTRLSPHQGLGDNPSPPPPVPPPALAHIYPRARNVWPLEGLYARCGAVFGGLKLL